jgi:hypothetical protein
MRMWRVRGPRFFSGPDAVLENRKRLIGGHQSYRYAGPNPTKTVLSPRSLGPAYNPRKQNPAAGGRKNRGRFRLWEPPIVGQSLH